MSELKLSIASFSDAGVKPINEDSVGYFQPTESYVLKVRGAALCLADGVSTAEAGKQASEFSVGQFIDEYYRTPESWSVSRSGEKILSTINLNLYRKSNEFSNDKGYLCTFSCLVIKGATGHFFHVGDSRIYLLRDGELKQISHDHTANIGDNRTVLARAMGMDNRLHVDYGRIDLNVGDRLLVTSDGVHDFVPHEELQTILSRSDLTMKEISAELKAAAKQHHTDDNLSAIVVEVESLFERDRDELSAELTRLPFPPDITPGMKIDGYEILKELFASPRSQLYLVRDTETGAQCVMKTPSLNFEGDLSYIDRFVQEEWVGSRISSPYVVRVIPQSRPRTFLYYLMEYVDGVQLEDWMAENSPPSPKRAIEIIKQVAAGLQAFHDQETVHQDLKPGNIMIRPDGQAIIVDFGSVYVAGLAELDNVIDENGALGTASYSDPNYLLGVNPGFAGDVYSLATIVYEMFTSKLPYGPAINDCRAHHEYDRLRYKSASEHRPQIPLWFDRALEKGVSFSLKDRYATIADFMRDLTHPNVDFIQSEPVSTKEANSELFWKLMSGFWFLTFLLVLYLFSQS